MPTYEYHCQTCDHRFEFWQKMTDEPLTICPECGNHIRRVLFPANIVFKGPGFYKTDHHSVGGANGHAKTSEHAESSKESETTTPSESKSSENKVSTGTKS